MAITATLLRPGAVIMHNKDLHQVFSVEHRTPGNKRGFIQAKLRNLRTGSMMDYKFRAEDSVDKVVLDEVQMEYLYKDGDDYYFMNTENYEQLHLNRDTLGDAVEYLTSNLQIKIEFHEGKPVGVELPQTVDLTVIETEPGIKSATASSVTKPAKTETGLIVQVPPFIGEGEKIRVDLALPDSPQLETRKYLVQGRVQGVGFRFYVEREARLLGISGWVRNTPTGAVEVLATGTREQQVALRGRLHQGPRAARVDDVVESEAQPVPNLNTFRIEGAW
jgi:elongation factor P